MSNQLASELLYTGYESMAAKDFERALYLFTQAFEHDPSDTTPLFNRGYCNLALKNNLAAFEDFDNVVKMDPGYLGARIERAKAAESCEKMDFAREEWDRLVEEESDIPAVWSGRASFRSSYDGRNHAALKDAFQALHLDDEWDEAYHVLLWTLLNLGRYDDAIKIAETALKKEIELSSFMYAEYGHALYYARRYVDACTAFENASSDEDPPDGYTTVRYAQALFRSKQFDASMSKLNELREDDEWDGIRFALQAQIELQKFENNLAMEALTKSKRSFVRNYQVGLSGQAGYNDRMNMGWFYSLRASLSNQYSLSEYDPAADKAKAIEILSKLISVSPQDLSHAKAYPEFDDLWTDEGLSKISVVAKAKLDNESH